MTSECLRGLYDKTNIDRFYNQKSPNTLPSLLICNDRYQKQNNSYSNYILDNKNPNNSNNSNNNFNKQPLYIKNQSNTSDLYTGYAENIDIESELKWINHIDDNCFYDKHKMDLKTTKSLNKHYERIFKPQQEKQDVLKQRKMNEMNFIDQNCLDFNNTSKSFKECNIKPNVNSPYPSDNKSKLLMDSQPVYYQFHNDKYIDCYPCESLFNNFTRRGGIPNTVNRQHFNYKKN